MPMPCSQPQLLFLPPQASFLASTLPLTMLPLQLLISNEMSPHNHTLICGCSFQRYKHQEANLAATVAIQVINAVSNTICIPKCEQWTHLVIFGINVIPGVLLFGSTANLWHWPSQMVVHMLINVLGALARSVLPISYLLNPYPHHRCVDPQVFVYPLPIPA